MNGTFASMGGSVAPPSPSQLLFYDRRATDPELGGAKHAGTYVYTVASDGGTVMQ